MRHLLMRTFVLTVLAATVSTALALADPLTGSSFGYTPRVPVSALGTPLSGLDLSRFHVSTMVSVGGGSGMGTQGLQVTSLSYSFTAPLQMSVSLGNAWGSPSPGGSSMFLEGADLSFRPSANTLFQIHYQNVRSPLQYNAYPYFAPGWVR
jgi:hypothetical protein